MAVVFESLIMDICLIPVCLLITIFIHYFKSFSYWKLQNVPCIPPKFPFGNFDLLAQEKRTIGECVFELYKLSKLLKAKYMGLYIFTKPLLLVIDPYLIGEVLKEDKTYFQDYTEENIHPANFSCKEVKMISVNSIKSSEYNFKDTNFRYNNKICSLLINRMKIIIIKKYCTIWNILNPTINKEREEKSNVKLENIFEDLENKNIINYFDNLSTKFSAAPSTINYCMLELSQNEKILNKVQDEILTVLSNNNNLISYNTVENMKYLEQVIKETLRKYPPMPIIKRECKKLFKLPDTNVTIGKGVLVWISILGLHNDPLYYPEPEIFNPDRFTQDEELKRKTYTYFPFGNEIEMS